MNGIILKKQTLSIVAVVSLASAQLSYSQEIYPGADENSPSRSEYFSWINNSNEGTDEANTMVNLAFFRWLNEEYGMELDIYAMDAGVIDGKNFTGTMDSGRFRAKFPEGFGKVADYAAVSGTRLGLWGGPDGFGNTAEEAARRKEEMVSLCRDHNWELFKFDAVCGPLRPEYEDEFIDMMKECRKYSPDLILLNHRLGLEEARKYATTFLWEGQETYIDVHIKADTVVPYNRASVLSRGLVPELKRLTEDHGVCLSSYLDYWQDDIVLQAFNRSLILAPQIYGNPWLLRDDEFPRLARIFNVHRKYRDILVDGIVLPESYGAYAVARGDERTRVITMRNTSWIPEARTVRLDSEIGIGKTGKKLYVRQFHPSEKLIGEYRFGDEVEIEIPPFRAYMLIVSSERADEPVVAGSDYEMVRNVEGRPIEIDLLGMPGTTADVSLSGIGKGRRVTLMRNGSVSGGTEVDPAGFRVEFGGTKLSMAYNRKIADMSPVPVPEDASAMYEATVFAADNNALEVRSLKRSGQTDVKEVRDARAAFFNQSSFRNRGIWDRNLFDGDLSTGFWPSCRYGFDQRISGGCFRLDLGEEVWVEKIILRTGTERDLQPLLIDEGNYAFVSSDLRNWDKITYLAQPSMEIPVGNSIRYMKMQTYPSAIYEVEVYGKDGLLDPEKFEASNLFAPEKDFVAAWYSGFVLPEVADNSYLCIAVKGEHGLEEAYASVRIDGEFVPEISRSPAFQSNTFEYKNVTSDSNYTYYVPISSSAAGKKIDVSVLAGDKDNLSLRPEVWIWTDEIPYRRVRLTVSAN